jgi:CBS domain containing-hemolysin-like protein
MSILIISVALAMGISAACSLFEAVLLSLAPGDVAILAKRAPAATRIWQRLKMDIQKPIAVILIINTLSHTIGATVAGAQFESIVGRDWLALFSIVFSFGILQFTEILPKTVGVRYNRRFAPYMAWPLLLMTRVLAPFVYMVHLINRPFEGRRGADRPPSTLEEITALAGLARLSDLIGSQEERIITRATKMSQTRVGDVMIPLDQITFLSTSQDLTQAILTAHFDPHTRFPICEADDKHKVLGYINFKELIYRARTNPADPSFRGIIRPVHFCTPDDTASELLKKFVGEHEHMAIVRDEQGRTLGLVTLEDLVEEFVGEIEDEFDRLPRMCHQLSGGTWMVGGGYPVERLQEQIGAMLQNAKGSLSSWLIERFGRVPKANEIYSESGFDFLVRRTRRGKVFEVSIHPAGASGGQAAIVLPPA